MLLDASRDRIRRARAVAGAADALRTRFAIERALAAIDLRPRGIPSQAIVCVRHLRVPFPAARLHPWASEVDRAMQRLLARAARPFLEPVPPTAGMIVFADEAELLACLARDWRAGRADAWWWQGLLGGAVDEHLLQGALEAAPAMVPAVVELLAARGLAADVLRALPPLFCDRLAHAVARAFGVREWAARPSSARGPALTAPPPDPTPAALRRLAAAVSIPCAADVRPLSPSQRSVLALSLVLRRDPALVRGRGGAALVSYRSWDAVPAGPLLNDAGVAKPVTVGVPGRAPETTVAANQVRVSPDAAQPAPRTGDSSLDPGHPAAAGDAAEVARPRIVDDPIPDVPAVRESAETDQHVAPVAGRAPAPATLALAPDVVESDFAGVVYLVNLALYLQLYADFTRPLGASLDLPLGDFLAVIGERACGGRFTRDPVWAVLACLSGRDPEERPARDFAPPDDQDFESWRSDLAERLERRAAEALGDLPGPALPFLCARRGRLSLSATRLDVAFPLADHPVAIRLAGLDRTPGWVPAAGRVIELHYE